MEKKDKQDLDRVVNQNKKASIMLLEVVYLIFILLIIFKPANKINFYLGEFIGVFITCCLYFLLPICLINFIQSFAKYKKVISDKVQIISEMLLFLTILLLTIVFFIIAVILLI